MTTLQAQQLKHAYGDMIKANLNRLKGIARSYSHTVDGREDLLQEIFYQLWRGFASFKAQSQLNTWVYRVALNTAISYVRSRETKPQIITGIDFELDLELEQTSHNGDFTDSADILEQFILNLDKIDKAIMMLYLDDISHKQISEITGQSVNVISVRINRMKQKFKQQHMGD
ncbi:MAG: RNA polymerase sigma factor [Colwellia sp.]|nr:RNA polymerase sigma factor [Colwellia sp.]